MALQNISQKGWTKGLQACWDIFAQPKNSVPRVSNMLLARRGAWKTCDGSSLISAYLGAVQASFGPILEAFLFQPPGVAATEYILVASPDQQMASPGVGTAAVTTIGAITGLSLTNRGLYTTSPPTSVTFSGGGGTGASATITTQLVVILS